MKVKLITLSLLMVAVFTSCDDSTSEEFNNNNPNAVEKLITSIAMVSAQDMTENTTITINYNENNRVTSATDGQETSLFVYDNGDLTNITGQGDTFNIEELYESPYDAFETGEVEEYDANGNPKTIRFFEEEYDFNTNTYTTLEYTAEVSYDSQPNPYFYTLEAAGLIDVMDDVDLNFSMNPSAPEIVQARALFPSKNIKEIIYKDSEGNIEYEIKADYNYNSANYPTSATITGESVQDEEINVYSLTYSYME
ncbi:hypothetical protein [Lacinutrix salivirga]